MSKKQTYEELESCLAEAQGEKDENLLEKDQFLAAIYNGISHSVFVVDVAAGDDFRYAGLNPRHEALTGIANHEIIGRHPNEVLPE